MADTTYQYSRLEKRYRETATLKDIPTQEMVDIRNRITDAGDAELRDLAVRRARGEIGRVQFETAFMERLIQMHGSQYVFGRGGIDAMGPDDFARLSESIRFQREHLYGFSDALSGGNLSELQAAIRAGMYAASGTRSFEHGKASSYGVLGELPLYPGDNCEGLTRCRCSWDIEEDSDSIKAYWSLGGDHPCGPCQSNFAAYYPYTIEKNKDVRASDPTPIRTGLYLVRAS